MGSDCFLLHSYTSKTVTLLRKDTFVLLYQIDLFWSLARFNCAGRGLPNHSLDSCPFRHHFGLLHFDLVRQRSPACRHAPAGGVFPLTWHRCTSWDGIGFIKKLKIFCSVQEIMRNTVRER